MRLLPFSPVRLRDLAAVRLWTWGAIALSVALCALMTWLHQSQAQTINRARELILDFREARTDLAKGFLHLTLSGDAESPFRRAEGLALLEQAIGTLAATEAEGRGDLVTPEEPGLAALLRQRLEEFQVRLTAYRTAPVPGPERDLGLYLAFHELERLTLRVERASQQELTALMGQQRGRFGLALAGAIALLAALSALVHQIARRQADALATLRRREKMLNDMGHAAQVGGWEFDVATGKGTWTEEVACIHDLPPDVPPNREMGLKFYPGESRARLEAALAAAITHGTPYDLELEFQSAKGVRKWVRTIGAPTWEKGRVVRLQGALQDITTHKKAEAEIRHQTALIKSLLDSIPDLVFYKDRNGVYLGCNQAFAEFLGRPRETIVGQTDQGLFPPDLAAAYRADDARMLHSLKVHRVEEWVDRPAGRRVLLDTLKTPYWGPDRQPLGMLGISRDITARYEAEAALRASEVQLQNFLNTAAVPLIRCSRDLRYLSVNAAYTKLVGWPAEQIIGQPIATVAGLEVLRTVQPFIDQVLRGERVEFEAGLNFATVGPRWVHSIYSPERAPDGTVVSWVASITDITRRKQEEQRERHRTRILEMLATGQPLPDILQAIVTAVEAEDPTRLGSILLANPTGTRLQHGVAPRLPEQFQRAIDGLPIGPGIGACGTAAHTRQRVIIADLLTHPDCEPFRDLARENNVRACWSEPILSEAGGVLGTFAIYHREIWEPSSEELHRVKVAADLASLAITRQQAQAEILQLNARLEQRVQERTAALQAANEELDAFVYAVSHDLRAPLRAMNGFSQALQEDYASLLPPAAHLFLDQIQQGSRQMGSLIDGLLRLSRITRGDLEPQAVDLSALAQRILDRLRNEQPHRQVISTVQPGLQIGGDARWLEIALTNLLENAWKYTTHVTPATIQVTGTATGTELHVVVTDNGAGFDPRHAARLFHPFQRLHREEEFPGLGIGLATVLRIVRRHGGSIHATATPGQGATFTLKLPKLNPNSNSHDPPDH